MKFKLSYLLAAAVIMVSCERKLRAPEIAGSGTSGLIGKWNLVSTGGSTLSSVEADILGDKIRIESKLTYTSSNPKGYYDITSSQLKAVNVSYDYSGTINLKTYENDVLQSEFDNPVPATPIGPSNEAASIKIVSADSMAFLNVSPVAVQGASGTFAAPTGCKYKIEGNKLTLTMKYGATTTTNTGGSPLVEKIYADVNIVLQKQ
ncbi:MAG: hypothetical protein KGZ74_08810 [Chitinophagaceae bacterium]|nr:hypothetical protein [Chitinophagaceae bacterium]